MNQCVRIVWMVV